MHSKKTVVLVVTENFDKYKRGDMITKADEVEQVLKDYPHFVNKVHKTI